MKDGFNRTIDYLRISLTDRCNFRCVYCMPEAGVTQMSHEEILRIEEIVHVVRVAASMGISRVRLTGGEPLVRLGIVSLIQQIAETPGITDISLTTNGVLLPKMALDLKAAGLARVNISLDTLNAAQFKEITRTGELSQTLAGIDAALAAGFDPVKVNAVAVRSLHQNYLDFARLSVEKPLHVRFIEYMPVGKSAGVNGCGWGKADVITCEELLETINEQAKEQGLPTLVLAEDARPFGAGPARYYKFPNAQGTVGFISPMSHLFCGQCNRLRLTANGKLRPCLFSDKEYDIKAALRGCAEGKADEGSEDSLGEGAEGALGEGEKATLRDNNIRAVFKQALADKPDEHHSKVGTKRNMSQIGG